MNERSIPQLTALQREAWEVMSHAFQVLPGTLDTQLQRHHGLTYASFLTLRILADSPHGEMRMRLLAQRASVSMSRLSHLADRLESGGYLERKIMAEDRRSTLAIITDEGRTLAEDATHTVEFALHHMVFEPLTDDQVRTLREVFLTLHNRMDPERRGPRFIRR